MADERLQKVIAQAGIASRRKAEALITAGRVRVNGRIVTELGTRADPRSDRIEVDGKKITQPRTWTYILLNKPEGVVTTASDEFDRQTVLECLKGVKTRVFPVGRLDMDAEGALLLTNDGDVAAYLTHPAGRIEKVYRCKVRGQITDEALTRLTTGVILEDGFAQAHSARHLNKKNVEKNSWLELTVSEGRNHLVKRMCESVGFPVLRLRREVFAGLTCDDLRPGKWRHLQREELRRLKALARTAKRRRDKSRERAAQD